MVLRSTTTAYAMAKEWTNGFYQSDRWERARQSYINSQPLVRRGLCERCYANGIIKAGKIVHHKTYITKDNINDPNITLNEDNFELLCQDCHNKEHHRQTETLRDDVMFDKQGNLIQRQSNDD